MTLRDNVRNFLVGLTIAEVTEVLETAIKEGHSNKANCIKEWLDELKAEYLDDSEGDAWADGDDCINPAKSTSGLVCCWSAGWAGYYDYIDYPVKTTIPVNSIFIPGWIKALCAAWYDGSGSMLYAVSSTGGLTTGTICPITEYDDDDDRMRKWYYTLWVDLSADLGYAVRAARKAGDDDLHDLERAEKWVDEVCEQLADDYGLEDY